MSLVEIEERNSAMKKIKQLVILIIVCMVMLGLVACGRGSGVEEKSVESEPITTEESSGDAVESEEPTEESDVSESAVLSPEFKKTMDDYEAWFDHYCEVMKKYQENPSDLELLSEMTDLLTEETTMLEQMENMDESEMNSAELAYYIEVTARIEKKLLEGAY